MRILFNILSVIFLLSGLAFSQTSVFNLIGRWSDGPCTAVTVDGHYAYINNGSALEILDISNTAAFKSVGKLDLKDNINCIRVSGSYAYVCGNNGIYIVDLTDKASPKKTGTALASIASSIFIKDNFLYAACPEPGLEIIDVSNPLEPKITATVLKDNLPLGVFVVDSLAYVCCMDTGLYVMNVKNKTAPSAIGHYNFALKYNPVDIYVKDSIAYAAGNERINTYNRYGRLITLNIKNPANIFERSGISLTGDWHADAGKIVADGNYAYVSYRTDVGNYVTIADVSNPGSVHEVLKKSIEYSFDLAVKDKRLFVTAEHMGLLSYDITNPAAPIAVSSFKTAGITGQVVRKGDYLFVANDLGGLKVLDISKPSEPSEVYSYKGNSDYESCNAIFIKDTLLFAGFWGSGYGLTNFSLGNMPTLTKISQSEPSDLEKIAAAGNYVYVTRPYEFLIFNFTDPYHPVKIFSYTSTARDLDVALNGPTLYLLEKMKGVKIFDVSSPAGTALIGEIPAANAYDFSFYSGYLYVTIYKDVTKIFDVYDPKNPVERGNIADKWASNIIVRNGYAYVFYPGKGLKVYYIGEPANPGFMRSDETIKSISGMFVDKDFIILSELYKGFSIFWNEFASLSVGDGSSRVKDFALMQNYPNPFNPATTLSYSIPRTSYVELKVYDMLGREAASLVNKEQSAGEYKVQFHASNLPSGVYIYSIKAGEFRDSKKLMLVK